MFLCQLRIWINNVLTLLLLFDYSVHVLYNLASMVAEEMSLLLGSLSLWYTVRRARAVQFIVKWASLYLQV